MDSKTGLSRLLHTMVPFMVMAAMQKGILLLLSSRGYAGSDLASLLAFLPSAGVAAALFRVRTYDPPSPEEESVGPLVPRSNRICLLHTLAATAAMIGVMFAVSALMHGQATPYELPASAGTVTVLTVLSLCLIHPVIEEALFRGAFYGELRRMSPLFAILAQAVMFAIVHDTVDGMIYALTAGVILGILAEETGRLWPCVATHVLVNARSLVSVTLFAERGGTRYAMDSGILTVGAVAFVVLAATRARSAADPGRAHMREREAGT